MGALGLRCDPQPARGRPRVARLRSRDQRRRTPKLHPRLNPVRGPRTRPVQRESPSQAPVVGETRRRTGEAAVSGSHRARSRSRATAGSAAKVTGPEATLSQAPPAAQSGSRVKDAPRSEREPGSGSRRWRYAAPDRRGSGLGVASCPQPLTGDRGFRGEGHGTRGDALPSSTRGSIRFAGQGRAPFRERARIRLPSLAIRGA